MNETINNNLIEGNEGQSISNVVELLGFKQKPEKDISKELSKKFKTGECINVKVISSSDLYLEVDLGDITGVIPKDEVDPERDVKLQGFVGQVIKAKIIKLELDKNLVILSRKIAREEDAAELLNRIKVGDKLKGIVKVMLPYGCFVELGGIAGLLKNEQIAYRPVKAHDVFQVGDMIITEIIEISKKGRVYLSTKSLLPKPGSDIINNFKVGERCLGEVISVHQFGVFVKLEKHNIDSLCSLPKGKEVKVGQKVLVKINQVLPSESKIHSVIIKFLR